MNRTFKRLLCYIFIIVLSTPITQTAWASEEITWNFDNSSSTLYINGSGDLKDYNDTLNVAPWLPSNITSIKKVVIAEGITSIGDYNFFCCSELKEIIIPSTVKKIGNYAFKDCTKLDRITLSYSIEDIGEGAFYNCLQLKTVSLPETLQELKDYTFYGCSSLENINIPRLLTYVGKGTFANCTSIKSLTLGGNITNIGRGAFDGATNLTLNVSKGTYAYDYADIYGIPFAEAKEDKEITTSSTISQLNEKLVHYINFNKELCGELVHIAFYNSSNQIEDYIIVPILSPTPVVYLVTDNKKDSQYAKIMVWDSLDNLKPVSDVETVQISRP